MPPANGELSLADEVHSWFGEIQVVARGYACIDEVISVRVCVMLWSFIGRCKELDERGIDEDENVYVLLL